MNSDIYNPVKVSYLTDESFELRDELFNRFKNLSDNLERFFYDAKTPEKIKSLCDKFQLAPTQAMFLTCIIRDVAVAITYFGDMVKEVQTKLDVPEAKARQIAQAVTELYDFALEDIKKLQVEKFRDRIGKQAPITKPQQPQSPQPQPTKNVINLREQKKS